MMMLMDCSTTKLNVGSKCSAFLLACEAQAANYCRYLFTSFSSTFKNACLLHSQFNPFACHCTVIAGVRETELLLSLFGATHGFTGPVRTTTLVPGPWHTRRRSACFRRDARSGSRSFRGGYDMRNWTCHFIASDTSSIGFAAHSFFPIIHRVLLFSFLNLLRRVLFPLSVLHSIIPFGYSPGPTPFPPLLIYRYPTRS